MQREEGGRQGWGELDKEFLRRDGRSSSGDVPASEGHWALLIKRHLRGDKGTHVGQAGVRGEFHFPLCLVSPRKEHQAARVPSAHLISSQVKSTQFSLRGWTATSVVHEGSICNR